MRIIESTDHYSIGIDPPTSRFNITFTGLWDADVVKAFGRSLERIIGMMIEAGPPYGSFLTLFDVSQSTLLPRSVSDLVETLASDHGPASIRVAIVVSSMLQKLQYQRVAPQSMYNYFQHPGDAIAWLESPIEPS